MGIGARRWPGCFSVSCREVRPKKSLSLYQMTRRGDSVIPERFLSGIQKSVGPCVPPDARPGAAAALQLTPRGTDSSGTPVTTFWRWKMNRPATTTIAEPARMRGPGTSPKKAKPNTTAHRSSV